MTPTFAVVGAVNHGKSSVVSTLAEDDQVRVSAMPGETVEAQRFSLGELFTFIDTPGFQNAREALAELRDAADARDPLERYAAFIAQHRGEPDFDAECRLFEPIVQGAGIVYVVDASRPVLDIHLAEMELLRLTGAPRLAIVNRSAAGGPAAEWTRRLGQHFNAVRAFDAHAARPADRIELLETLAGIEQQWKPRLLEAVQVLRDAASRRLADGAEIIVQLLVDVLQHREVGEPAEADALVQRFIAAVSAREQAAHAALIALFGHRRVQAVSGTQALFADGLFSAPTWALLGLSGRQLVGAGAVAGAAAGAGVDVLTAGHTLLAGSAIGAAAGATGALLLGKRRPELGVRWPGPKLAGLLPSRLRIGGASASVGPYAAPNFPWIVLDRALGTLAYLAQRAHARRDEVALDAAALDALLRERGLASSAWPEADRKTAERAYAAARRERLNDDERNAFTALIQRQVERAAAD